MNTEWISVKDRLPDESGSCVCFLKRTNRVYREEKVLYYDDESNTWNSAREVFRDEVTHWIKLPEPPKP